MALIDRLLNLEEPKLPVHQFMAALAEYKRGAITRTQVADTFDLSADERTQLQAWFDNLDSDTISRELVHDVLMLGEVELYPRQFVLDRLGV